MPTYFVGDLEKALEFYTTLGFEEKWRCSVYLFVSDVDACHGDLKTKLGTAVSDLFDADYGMRDFSVKDPCGNELSIGQASE